MANSLYYTIAKEKKVTLLWFKSKAKLKYTLSYEDKSLHILFPYMSLQAGFEPETELISLSQNRKGLTAKIKLEAEQQALCRKTDENTLVVTII